MPKKKATRKPVKKVVKKSAPKVKRIEKESEKTAPVGSTPVERVLEQLNILTQRVMEGKIHGLVFVSDGDEPYSGWCGTVTPNAVVGPMEMIKTEIIAGALAAQRAQGRSG